MGIGIFWGAEAYWGGMGGEVGGNKRGDKGRDKGGNKRWNRLERGREGETDVIEPKCYFTFSL